MIKFPFMGQQLMAKQRLATTLLLGLSLTPLPLSAAIEEVIITASPLAKNGDTLSQPAAVLSGDELRRKAASTLGDTLNDQPGMSSASFGPGVGAPVIRGQSANRVKVMQNQLGTMDAASASPDHANSVEPLLAERIEVLRGPATLRFGNDAIGGVVNVIDNSIPSARINGVEGAIEARYQSVNQQKVGVGMLEGGSDRLAWHLDGVWRESQNVDIPGYAHAEESHESPELEEEEHKGIIENTDAQADSFSAGASWFNDTGFIGLAISQLNNNYGIPPGGHEHEEEEPDHEEEPGHEEEEALVRIDLTQTRYDLKGEQNNLAPWIEKLSYRLAYNDYQHIELEGDEAGTKFQNKAWEGRAEVIHTDSGDQRGAFGIQAGTRDFAAIGDEAFIPRSDIDNLGAFVLEEFNRSNWVFELGARAEYNAIAPDDQSKRSFNTYSLSGAAHWHINDAQHLTFSLARAQRAPSVEELFSLGAHLAEQNYVEGNADLKPETSLNTEIGYHYEGPVHLELNLFNNAIDNFIYKANTGAVIDELPVYAYVQDATRFYGAEIQLTLPLNSQWQLQGFVDAVRAKFDKGGDVPRINPPRAGISLSYEDDQWQLDMRATAVSEQKHPGEGEFAVDGYNRLDLSASRNLNLGEQEILLFIKGNNLSNAEIRNASSFLRAYAPEPGRSVELGARLSF
ncbi:TonB-dependent receptor [Simiduia curdlanivorans]|uniref:TonB-dependent receptor n=1 Tax=Simiduia curdlanivorans TaxID=1492769 RepID=A0ABV8V404_9GAMM|nr:TonB-dependent receptor [Simiduia curdlanivorans]MDN3637424.1 TonB-dependent receptor [Simiduia curdlanivorans]